MIVGLYCNWGVIKYKGEYYVPSIHKNYLDIFKAQSSSIFLLSKTIEREPSKGFVKIPDVGIIELPYFSGYQGAVKHFFKIAKGIHKLLTLSGFVYVRVPEPFAWYAGFASFFMKVPIHFHYTSFPFEVINSYKAPRYKRLIKKLFFFPEYLLTAFSARLGSVSSLGVSGVNKLPVMLRRRAFPLYEVSYTRQFQPVRDGSDLLSSEKVRFLYVGRLVPGKGLEDLMRCVNIVYNNEARRDFAVTIVGDGPLQEELAEYSSTNGLESVLRFLGPVPFGEELDAVYGSHDVLVSPSYSESGPRSVVEASSNYLYIISTDTGYVKELYCRENQHCYLFSPGDVDEMVAAFIHVMDHRLTSKLHAEAAQRISTRYNLDDFVKAVLRKGRQ